MSTQLTQPTQQIAKQSTSKEMEFVPFGQADSIKLSVEIVKNLIAVPTKSGKTCSDREAIKFMMLCKAQRLNPFAGDAYLIGYDGRDGATFSLITAHVAFLKRAETHPEFDGMKSGIIVVDGDDVLSDIEGDFHLPKQKVVGGWATVYFKNRKHPITRRVKLSRFQKSFGVWQEDPAGMICKVAEADALRSSFPTLIGGLYMKDEINPDSADAVIEMVSKQRPSTPDLSVPANTKPSIAPASNNGDEDDIDKTPTDATAPTEPAEPEKEKVVEKITHRVEHPAKLVDISEPVPIAPDSPQAGLIDVLTSAGVDLTMFATYINVNKVDVSLSFNAEMTGHVSRWPDAACKSIASNAQLMSRIVQKYGSKKTA